MWVAVGKGSNTIAYSLNMLDWTGLGSTLFSIQGNSVHYYKNKWIVVGSGAENTIGYSYDGFKWKGLGKSIFSVQGNSCAYNGSLWYPLVKVLSIQSQHQRMELHGRDFPTQYLV